MEWLSNEIKKKIKKRYEPLYKRRLEEKEVISIAENLAGLMETILKFRFREKYEKQKQQA